MKHNFKDERLATYEFLTAIRFIRTDSRRSAVWLYKCVCGSEKEIVACRVREGSTISCGCYRKSLLAKGREYKGKRNPLFGTKFYFCYAHLKQRCTNPKNPKFSVYGGRGIKCEWPTFYDFKNDMYESFIEHEKQHGGRNTSIDRIDVDGNYCKENCRWATTKEQCLNTRRNLTYKGRCGKVQKHTKNMR